MATQTIELPVQRPAADLEALFPGRYLSVTSFKRDGTGVATPPPPRPPIPRPAERRRGAALAITVGRPDPLRDDESHTPPHGDALLVHGGGELR